MGEYLDGSRVLLFWVRRYAAVHGVLFLQGIIHVAGWLQERHG
jgi:hypothetical protein